MVQITTWLVRVAKIGKYKAREVFKVYDENYANLANAIILRAVADYKEAKKIIPNTNDVSFLKSQYFQTLTSVSGECILEELEK